jgi:Mrp family chromosome partitioning ATPase
VGSSKNLRERLRVARQLGQTIPHGSEQPAPPSMSLNERLHAPRQPDPATPKRKEQRAQTADEQAVHEEAEPAANGHVDVAKEQAADEEAEPATNGRVEVAADESPPVEVGPAANGQAYVADEEAAPSEVEPANGHAQVANEEEVVQKEAPPATKGRVQLAHELKQATRDGAQPSQDEERLPSQFSQSINDALTPRQALPGFADPRLERINSIELPPWFIDRCRTAYLSVRFDPATDCRVIGVTSAAYGEGKTSVAIGTATAMALDTKKPTLLIECDFAFPSFYKFFGISEAGGLSDWLVGGSRLRIVRGAALVPNLFVVPSGTPQSEPARFFYQLVDRNVFEGLRGIFGNVVIDLPPTLHISYGSLAWALADRLLIVARSRLTLAGDLETMVTRIGKDRVSGIVLTGADDSLPGWLRSLL